SMPASRSARTRTFAPRSCPSRPGFAISTLIGGRLVISPVESGIDIEALTCLATQFPGCNQPPKQDRRTVLVLTEVAMQYLHDREDDIEPDQVRQLERTHRVRSAEFHGLVNCLACRHASLEAHDRLVEHRHQHAIHYESGRVRDLNRGLSHPGG